MIGSFMQHIPRYIMVLLSNPYAVFVGVISGLLTGIFLPEFAAQIGDYGEIILNLMKMCVLPIIVTSVSISIFNVMHTEKVMYLVQFAIYFVIVLILCGLFGALFSYFVDSAASVRGQTSPAFIKVVEAASTITRGFNDALGSTASMNVAEFMKKTTPDNIFSAFANSKSTQVIIFAIIFGITMGFQLKKENQLTDLIETLYQLFLKMFEKLALLLPIAIFLIVGRDLSKVGSDTILGMANFIMKIFAMYVTVYIISHIIIVRSSGKSIMESFASLKYTLFIAFTAQASLMTIPPAIKSMIDHGVSRPYSNMFVPMGTVVGRYGNILYFAFCTMFVLDIYQIDLDAKVLFIVSFMSVMAGITTTGLAGTLTIPLMALILDPIGVPLSAVIIIFVIVDPIIEPFRTLANVYVNCAVITGSYRDYER